MNKEESIYKTALLLIDHFEYCIQREAVGEPRGIHTRIFSHILHPEAEFVAVGSSKEVVDGAKPYPEHAVPCATLIIESCRLLKDGIAKRDVAALLAKHWKIVYISKEQAIFLDAKKGLGLKSTMPAGWSFQTGDSFARLHEAKIEIFPLKSNLKKFTNF